MSKRNALIVGGTKGLGFQLAHKLFRTHKIFAVGRDDPNNVIVYRFIPFDLKNWNDGFAKYLASYDKEPWDLIIFNAGFFQDGTIGELDHKDIVGMINLGLVAPIDLISAVLIHQKHLPGFIVVTSTSQWTPRLREPVYTAVKAGLGMFANSVSLDPAIGKTLVAAPAGMKTPFWKGVDKDTSDMLDPEWVADQILFHYATDFDYQYIRILRGPARVDVVERRLG